MADALRLKVDENLFRDTLDKLNSVLEQLAGQRSRLAAEVQKLDGETFSGSNVNSAKELAKEALNYCENSIKKVTAQKVAIERFLEESASTATTLDSDINTIRNELPDLFK